MSLSIPRDQRRSVPIMMNTFIAAPAIDSAKILVKNKPEKPHQPNLRSKREP